MKKWGICMAVGLGLIRPVFPVQGEPYTLEPVVVTARKKEETARNVPVAMDVFSGMDIEDARIEETNDLVRLSPNVSMMERSCEHIVVIRGISPFRGTTYSPAGFYVDGVSYPLHYMQNIDFFDLERAEVLKGPQGTLYGRNTESGLINLITRQPDTYFQGKISTGYGGYNTFRSNVSLSGPVADNTLYMGGSVQYTSSDGYWENLSNADDRAADQEHLGGRLTLRWTPGDRWDITLAGDTMTADDHGASGPRALYGPLETGPHTIRSDEDAYLNQDWNSQSVRVTYRADTLTLTSVSALLNQSMEKVNDCDLSDDPSNRRINPMALDERMFSQEIRLSSAGKGPFQWLAGVYGFMEDAAYDYQYKIVSANAVYQHPVTDIDTGGAAVFGQGTYAFFDRLRLTAGLRLDYQHSEGRLRDAVRNTAYDHTLSNTEILPKVSLDMDLIKSDRSGRPDRVMVYASVARGYMAGGFNWGNTGIRDSFTYGPEYTLNYEMGLKSTWLDQKLMVNLSVFHIDMDDKQVSEQHPTLALLTITNAARAHSRGLELQVKARPVPGLDLFGGLGITRSQYDTYAPRVQTNGLTVIENRAGNHLIYAPEYTYNIGMQYYHRTGVFGRIDLLGTGPFYGDAANTARQDGYETVNLRLGYEWEHFQVSIWGENIFDRHYATMINPFLNTITGVDGPPRNFGVSLTYRF